MAKKKKPKTNEPTILNRRARHDYTITDTLEVGIRLLGSEVKSVRDGRVSLAEGYVKVQQFPLRLELHSVNISEYPPAGGLQHKPGSVRQLLAHKREIARLAKDVETKGVTVVPLKMYFKNGFVKLEIGVGVGRSAHDKRNAIGERESRREIQRAMSKRM